MTKSFVGVPSLRVAGGQQRTNSLILAELEVELTTLGTSDR